MTIDKLYGDVWADDAAVGDIDTDAQLTTAKVGTGYKGGDQPTISRFNKLQNRSEGLANRIRQERLNSFYDDATDAKKMIVTGQWDDPWGSTSDAANVIEGGALKEYRDMCVYFDSDGNPYLLVLDNANTKIEVYNARTLALVVTTNALTDDLETGGTEAYECISMCTDGTSVYVVFTDTNAAPDEHWLQCWDIDLTSADWGVKNGWTDPNGTQLAGTGSGVADHCRDSKVIIADGTHLAVSCGWTDITAAGDPAIQLFLQSTGAAVRDGAGDATTGANYYPTEGICSDGTNIFFSTGTAVGVCKIASATIADLTAGSGGAGYPLLRAGTANHASCRLCQLGVGGMFTSANYFGAARADTDTVLRTHDATTAVLDAVLLGQDSSAAPVDGDKLFWADQGVGGMAFDGLSLWSLTHIDNGASYQNALIKIDTGKFSGLLTDQRRGVGDICSAFIVSPGAAAGVTDATIMYQSIAFDGRDMWCIVQPQASTTNSGNIFRLPLALIRN